MLRVSCTVLIALALWFWSLPASATPPGITLDRIDITLEIPDPDRDHMLQTRHTIVLYGRSVTPSGKLPLPIAPLIVRATDASSGLPAIATRRVTEDEGFTDVVLPSGASNVKLEFTAPVFEGAIPRFWWDETQMVLGWPFTPTLRPLTQGMQVTVVGPPKLGRAPGFSCVSVPPNVKCSRFFSSAELARYSDSRTKGLVVGSIVTDDAMPLVVSGAQLGLWALLLVAIAIWRGQRTSGKKRTWMLVRTALALAILVPSLAAWAYAADGETDGPLASAMAWAAGFFGVTALMFAQLENEERPVRTKLGQLAMLAAMPLGVGLMLLSKQLTLSLGFVAGAAVTGFVLMYGESSD